MTTRIPYDAVPYVNQHGETLNPGDFAVAVTTGMGQGNLRCGRYRGLRKGKVVMDVKIPTVTRRYKSDKSEVGFAVYGEKFPYPSLSKFRRESGGYDYDAYRAASQEQTVARKQWEDEFTFLDRGFRWGSTQLQRNNIRPASWYIQE